MSLALELHKEDLALEKEKERVRKEDDKRKTMMFRIAHDIFMRLSKKYPLTNYDKCCQKIKNILDIKHNDLLNDLMEKNKKYSKFNNKFNRKKYREEQIPQEILEMRSQCGSDFTKTLREIEAMITNQYLEYLINEEKS